MEHKELDVLTNQELLAEAKKMKSSDLINAFLIGFLAAVFIYGFVKNGFGFFGLIPLFFIYKLNKSSKYKKEALKSELKKRGLN